MASLPTPAAAALAPPSTELGVATHSPRVQLREETCRHLEPIAGRYQTLLAVGLEARAYADEFDYPANGPRDVSPDREPGALATRAIHRAHQFPQPRAVDELQLRKIEPHFPPLLLKLSQPVREIISHRDIKLSDQRDAQHPGLIKRLRHLEMRSAVASARHRDTEVTEHAPGT
jgi:hypothetical protein